LIHIVDSTPPTVTDCPADVAFNADPGGCDAFVTWPAPTVIDNCDPAPTVEYDIDLGDDGSIDDTVAVPEYTFPAGPNRVYVRATDACGNPDTSCDFAVAVEAVNALEVTLELVGVSEDPVTRCVRLVIGECGNITDLELTFTNQGDPFTGVRATATLQLTCGDWGNAVLCAKDEQHTLYDTSTLVQSGSQYVTADPVLMLLGGDTDNDSDVDIDDVTWLLYQYGGVAEPGGCPWDGTRDADFSLNGVVGLEDYLFFSENWHAFSACGCTSAPPEGDAKPLNTEVQVSALPAKVRAKVDLTRDGIVDYRDVEAFERRHGLGNELSSRIKWTAKASTRRALP
jgi:hypothetical protein